MCLAVITNRIGTEFDVYADTGLTKFVGREDEFSRLVEGLQRAKAGHGQVFSVVGGAGFGKSRLLHEFKRFVRDEDVKVLEGQCHPYGRGVAYHPITEILKANFGIVDADSDAEIRDKVQTDLELLRLESALTLPYVLELLSVTESGIEDVAMSPHSRREMMVKALELLLTKGSETRTLVLVLEDLHWLDRSSKDVAKSIVEVALTAKVLMICTYRPEAVLLWEALPFCHRIALSRLHEKECVTMVGHLVGTSTITDSIEELVINRTKGVPLFIEEFVQSLKELRIIEKLDDRFHLTGAGLTMASTIQEVVMGRVNRLPEGAREILQIGSAINREFSYKLMAMVTGLSEHDLMSRLSILMYAGLIYERGAYPESSYVFKHFLIQEACYESLPTSTRRRYHRAIAEAMERSFHDKRPGKPEVVAHHFSQAGLVERALPYWSKAASNAIRRSANTEGIAYLRQALETIGTLPTTRETMQQELDLLLLLGPALMAVKGYAAREVEKIFARARELVHDLGAAGSLLSVLRGLWGYYIVRADLGTARDLAEQTMRMAEHGTKPSMVLWGLYMSAMTRFHLGDFVAAGDHFKKGGTLYDVRKRGSHRALQDPGVACLSYQAPLLWLVGFQEQALRKSLEALSLAEELSHPFSLVYALNIAALTSQLAQRVEEVLERAEASISLCSRHGMPYWSAWGPILKGWALASKGRTKEGIELQRQGLADYVAGGATLACPYFHCLLVEALAKEGRFEEGLRVTEDALIHVYSTGDRWFEAELHRLKGELLLAISATIHADAEACYQEAFRVARLQGAKSLELRTAMSLGLLRQQQGRNEEAFQIISEVYRGFEEGFQCEDLKKARTLIEQLG